MLESSFFPVQSDPGMARLAAAQATAKTRPVFRMETDPEGRIDGSIPVWDNKGGAEGRVADTLGKAAQQDAATAPGDALAYSAAAQKSGDAEPFGFGDLVDMVNPLQHIPLVSTIYRHLTGDTIKPVSQVIGSAIYGGPFGAAAALVNVIIKDGTGKDISGNLVSLAFNESPPPSQNPAPPIELAAQQPDLPGSVLSFADLGSKSSNNAAPAPLPQIPPQPLKLADFSPFEIY